MRIETHCEDRRYVADAIGKALNEQVHYDGVPTCSYSVGPVTVARDGSVSCDDTAAWKKLLPLFDNEGWQYAPLNLKPEVEDTLLAVMLSTITPEPLIRMLKTLYVRQNLINAMLRRDAVVIEDEVITLLDDRKPDTMDAISELLESEIDLGMMKGITICEGRLYVAIPAGTRELLDPEPMRKVLTVMAGTAFNAHYVKCVKLEPEISELKYFCHSWLMQLGFGGPKHKELRAALLGHLPGFAAFRNEEQMKDHKERFIQRRREERQAREAEVNEADREEAR